MVLFCMHRLRVAHRHNCDKEMGTDLVTAAGTTAPAGLLGSSSQQGPHESGRVKAAQQRRGRTRVHPGQARQRHPHARVVHGQLRCTRTLSRCKVCRCGAMPLKVPQSSAIAAPKSCANRTNALCHPTWRADSRVAESSAAESSAAASASRTAACPPAASARTTRATRCTCSHARLQCEA